MLTLFAMPVFAQSAETRVLLDRITQMEQQVQELSRRAYGSSYVPGNVTSSATGTASAGGMTPDMLTRLASIENQLRDLTGQVEQASFAARQANDNLEKLKADTELRLSQLEQAKAPPSAADNVSNTSNGSVVESEAAVAASDTSTGVPDDSLAPEELYNNAYAAMQRKEYSTAEKDFRNFLATNPKHKLAPNAQYWLGETYFARANYKAASAVFAESYQKYPKANKAPDSLLKLGLSLSEQKRTKDACTVLRQLTKEYPSASGTIATRTETELKKLKCQ